MRKMRNRARENIRKKNPYKSDNEPDGIENATHNTFGR
jgi:hypothetical protein